MGKQLTGLLVDPDGTVAEVTIDEDWQAIAKVIGSQWIERVHTSVDGVIMYVDEEGWMNKKVANLLVDFLYAGIILGPAFIIAEAPDDDGELAEVSLSPEQLEATLGKISLSRALMNRAGVL